MVGENCLADITCQFRLRALNMSNNKRQREEDTPSSAPTKRMKTETSKPAEGEQEVVYGFYLDLLCDSGKHLLAACHSLKAPKKPFQMFWAFNL